VSAEVRVLFLHGLESGPNGTKTRLMRAQGLAVTAPDLHMSRLRLDKRNSFSRQMLRHWEMVVAPGQWVAKAVAASRRACVDIARRALKSSEVDVVVGSSWGGAVAVELLRHGTWLGPTVLLAPATREVQNVVDAAGWQGLVASVRRAAHSAPVVIFHDPNDATISVEGSRDLAAGAALQLHEVDAGGHRLLDLVEDGRLAAMVRNLAQHVED
jgi:dienelactone hydrolase